jgi:spermidine synthase
MLGLFSLVAQTLLFRDFLSVYEGSELGIGVFLSSWLAWVALGAIAARKTPKIPNIDLLFLLYLPAYILQQFLILHSRELAGIETYELFPFLRMLPVSFLANAPVSFVTGLLFPLACRWFEEQERDIPVSRAYTAEALGSFIGGVAVTALLMAGMLPESIFLCAALMLTGTVLLSSGRKTVAMAVVVLLIALVFSGTWNTRANCSAWARLLPPEQYKGSFTTEHARYLYGSHRGQFNVVSFESVMESIPQTEYASELAALHLAQKPDARHILVLGTDGYALCRRLAEFPSIKEITWLHPDIRYPARLLEVLPPEMKNSLEKIEMPLLDVRSFLQRRRTFDLIILKQPDASTLANNRYYTEEFFRLVREALAPGGVVGVRMAGGENFMGGELVRIGASVFKTLNSHFTRVALKPGDETWLLASNTDHVLTQDVDQLVSRYASITGAAALYPPNGLRSLYPADRAEFQMKAYRGITGEELINRDRHPLALFHTLLLAARQGGVSENTVQAIVAFSRHGFAAVLSLILIYGFLRAIYLGRSSRKEPATLDSCFLVVSTGFAGLALNVVLMFLFQSRFGSLFLYAGLISSLFMLGLFCGALLAWRKNIVSMFLPLHALCTAALALFPAGLPIAAYFAILFVFGLFSGTYIPAASRLLPLSVLRTGSTVDMYDHVGGAVGGLLIGILFLPVFGTTQTLLLTACLLAVNIYPIIIFPGNIQSEIEHQKSEIKSPRFRAIGYILFGIAALHLVVYHTAPRTAATPQHLYEEAVKALKAQPEAGKVHVFDSRKQAPDVYGYGGPLWMAVAVDNENRLLDFKIYRHWETPSYLRMIGPWINKFIGRDLSSEQIQGVDAVSGATLTCNAFKNTLVCGAKRLHGRQGVRSSPMVKPADIGALLAFAFLCMSALFLRTRPNRWGRRLFMVLVLLLAGVHLNMQYSTDHLWRLFALELPRIQTLVPFLLTVAVPALVLLFGNIYCGWLCPFGALQELAGACIRRTPEKEFWRYARFVKYILLFALIIFFVCSRGRETATADPLVSFFSPTSGIVVFCFGSWAVLMSVFYGRFWCRNLCPVGAFLSLLNRIRLLRRWIPTVPFTHCDYGVCCCEDLDCMCCDRCRSQNSARVQTCASAQIEKAATFVRGYLYEIILLIVVAVSAVLWLGQLRTIQENGENRSYASKILRTTGNVRNVDMQMLHSKIRRGQLSEREALYYDTIKKP